MKTTYTIDGRMMTYDLKNAQVSVLKTLNRARGPMPSGILCERAEIAYSGFGEHVGSHEAEYRDRSEKRSGFLSLITLGAVEVVVLDGERCYKITAKGRDMVKSVNG